MTTSFVLAPRRDRWLAGAGVVVDLRVENRGPAPVELPNPMLATSPQPAYRLTRPDGAEVVFTPAGDRQGPVSLVRLATGQAWVGELTVNDRADASLPGHYTLSAVIEWGGVRLEADPVAFEVVPARYAGLVASLALADTGSVVRECVLLQRDASGASAFGVKLRETNPNLAEMAASDPVPRGLLPVGATELLGVYANYATGLDPLRWTVARDAAGVHVGTNAAPGTVLVPASHPVLACMTPLAVAGGTLYLPAVLDAGASAHLALARLDAGAGVPSTTGFAALWDLGAWPAAAAAHLGPASDAAPLVVAMAFHLPTGTRVAVAALDLAGRILAQATHDVEGLWAERVIAAWRARDGAVRCAFIARGDGTADDAPLHLVERAWDAGLADVRPGRNAGALGLARGGATDAQVAYFERAGEAVDRLVWVRYRGGEAFVVTGDAAVRPSRAPVAPTSPVAFVPGRDRWYAVHYDAHGRVTADGV